MIRVILVRCKETNEVLYRPSIHLIINTNARLGISFLHHLLQLSKSDFAWSSA